MLDGALPPITFTQRQPREPCWSRLPLPSQDGCIETSFPRNSKATPTLAAHRFLHPPVFSICTPPVEILLHIAFYDYLSFLDSHTLCRDLTFCCISQRVSDVSFSVMWGNVWFVRDVLYDMRVCPSGTRGMYSVNMRLFLQCDIELL
jgi:hypothetical protein